MTGSVDELTVDKTQFVRALGAEGVTANPTYRYI